VPHSIGCNQHLEHDVLQVPDLVPQLGNDVCEARRASLLQGTN